MAPQTPARALPATQEVGARSSESCQGSTVLAEPSRDCIALDFDGVLCDSARETAISAWRAGRQLWPEWSGEAPSAAAVARFLEVRPWLETGYQAIVMMRMIADGAPDSAFAEDLEGHCQRVLGATRLQRQDLVRLFGQARDEWLRRDEAGWLAAHEFYPGVVEAVRSAQERADVVVITTKQERFARALLESRGVRLAEDRLYGLERGRSKTAILGDLMARSGPAARFHFVEDRAETLRQVLAEPALAGVRLFYAAWGYGTPADLAWARREPRVRVWSLDEFLVLD